MRHMFCCSILALLIGLAGCTSEDKPADVAKRTPDGLTLMNPPKSPKELGKVTAPADSSREDVIYLEPDFTAKSEDLVTEFTSTGLNDIKAKYTGKVVEVTGTICFVDQVTYENGIDHGAIYVNLCPTEKYEPKTVRCEFVMDTMYAYSGPSDRLLIIGGDDTLARGEQVVVRGYYKLLGARDFRMDGCQLMRH